jgi:hypothetical protein
MLPSYFQLAITSAIFMHSSLLIAIVASPIAPCSYSVQFSRSQSATIAASLAQWSQRAAMLPANRETTL